jgi:hypothetical protein
LSSIIINDDRWNLGREERKREVEIGKTGSEIN